MQAHDDGAPVGDQQQLQRSLTLPDLLAYGLVFMVPIAPVTLFGIVFNASHGMVPLVYTMGLIAMLFTALSYTAMAWEYPVAGSVYTYASHSLGQAVGFLGGWAMLLDYVLIPTISYVTAAIAVHAAIPIISRPLCVLIMLCAATVINIRGIQAAARASFVLLAVQLLIIVLLVLLSVRALIHPGSGVHLSLLPFYNPTEFKPGLLFGALSFAVLSFLGFDAISTLAEEANGGAAAIGRATLMSLCICAVLFVVQTWLAALFLPGQIVLPPGDPTQAAFYGIADRLGGFPFKFLLAVPGVFVAALAGAVTAQAATARLLYGMARDGKLPRALARVDERRGVPLPATMLVAAVTLILGLALVNQLEFLSSMISFGALLGFVLLHISVIKHFIWDRRSRQWVRHLVVPLIGLVIVLDVFWNIQLTAKLVGAVWLIIGVAVFLLEWRQQPGMSRSPAPAQARGDLCRYGTESQ